MRILLVNGSIYKGNVVWGWILLKPWECTVYFKNQLKYFCMTVLHNTSSPKLRIIYHNVESKSDISDCRPANNELSRKI
jgi:hypothetical protein